LKYCIDTSAILDGWVRYYPPDVFCAVWARLDALIHSGDLVACEEVLHELEKKDDQAYSWAKQRRCMFKPLDDSVQDEATNLLTRFSRMAEEVAHGRSTGDPFIIAFAKVNNLVMVTGEKSKPTSQKIPDVCDVLGIEHIRLLDLFRREAWRFHDAGMI